MNNSRLSSQEGFNQDVIALARSNQKGPTDAQIAILDLHWNNFLASISAVIDEQGLCNTVSALKMVIERKQKHSSEDSQSYKDLEFARDILAAASNACDLDGTYLTRRTAMAHVLEDIANIEVMK